MTNMSFKKFTAIAFLLALLGAPVSSQASEWQVDYDNSKIGIIASVNGTIAEGRFNTFTAAIFFDPKDPASAKITATIDLASVTMKDPQQTAALAGSDWFDTSQFPKATFNSTLVKATGPNTFEIFADLTLKNKTVAVKLPFRFAATATKAHATGEFSLMRKEFNIGLGQFSSAGIVAFEVKIQIDILAHREK